MGKGYKVVEPIQLDPLMVEGKHHVYAVALFHWLVKALYDELSDQLGDAEIEVIKVTYLGSYPALGVHYPTTYLEVEDLVWATAERLLDEKPISEAIKFIAESDLDWNEVTANLMK